MLFTLNEEISSLDREIRQAHRTDETSLKLAEVPASVR
jgi:hypothetical protein